MITEECHTKLMPHPFMSCMISLNFKHFIEQNSKMVHLLKTTREVIHI
jgi:hypothetical protein